jgi:hypothetical protein
MSRWHLLPDYGSLLVSTDLHGNGEDFSRLQQRFLDLERQDVLSYWVILGDAVHAPDDSARRRRPDLYDYPDESLGIVESILDLMAAHPGHVFYVLGNHDVGHVGGPPTRKFFPNEVAHLEAQIGPYGTARLRELFAPALLAVIAPCGILLSHGSPDDALTNLDDLNEVKIPPAGNGAYQSHLLDSFLNSYGQREEVTARLLARLSEGGPRLQLVVHGHDRDENGYFTEGGNQVCPVLFGAPREKKRFLLLDLAGCYQSVGDLREGKEIRTLYE